MTSLPQASIVAGMPLLDPPPEEELTAEIWDKRLEATNGHRSVEIRALAEAEPFERTR